MLKAFRFTLAILAAIVLSGCKTSKLSPDAEFHKISDEYLEGHLAWRPTVGMSLGLHQYDGRITDFSRASLDAELRRLKSFQAKLACIDAKHLSHEISFDYRLLQSAVGAEI